MTEIRTYTVKTKEVKNQLKVIFCDCDVHLQKWDISGNFQPLCIILISTSLLDDDDCCGARARPKVPRKERRGAGREMESDIVVLTSICAPLEQAKSSFLIPTSRGQEARQKRCFIFLLYSVQNEKGETTVMANLIKEESDLIHLWESVRFPHLSATFISQVVASSPFWQTIARTQSYATSQMHPEERRRWLITYF